MHELSLMNNLFHKIEQIAKNESACAVSKVHVKIGALAHISAEHFREHFDELRENSVAKEAELLITVDHDIYHPQAQDITLISVEVLER